MSTDVVTFDGLFAERELDELWNRVERARADDDSRPFSFTSTFENGRIFDPGLAASIFSRCAPLLPSTYEDAAGRSWRPVRACDHLFYAIVSPGQKFGLHTDTGSVYDATKDEYSKFTVLIYLDESGRDFEGGHTVFIRDPPRDRVDIVPARDRLLMFDIDLFHYGEEVRSGTKRWVGTEFVYRLLHKAETAS
jgi:hypothetical protein